MKIATDPLYLTARQAAGELSVAPATLYAYVSRGLIRSEPIGDARERRYRAEDVRALKHRRGLAGGAKSADTEPPILDSAVSTITEDGPVYRGVRAVSLAADATLEQAATLLWDVGGVDPFAANNLPVMNDAMRGVLAATAEAAPLSRAIAVLALAAEADPQAFNRSADGRARIGARIVRLVAAATLGAEPSGEPIHAQVAQAWAPGDKRATDLLRRALVLLADHELNASTYTLRCAASTGLNLYDATVAGMTALKGPKHGGAGPLARHLVTSLADGGFEEQLRQRIALGERIAGFGHSVYKNGDPRAEHLLAALRKAGADRRLATEAPAFITDSIGLYPNVDYALAVMMHMLNIPPGREIALFAIARTAGWVAHGIEQLHSEKLIRPRARYVGAAVGRSAAR